MKFPLSSEDCELLLLLETTGSIAGVAHRQNRDISVVSRQINRIAETHPVVEKIDGKWQISQLGKHFTIWARDSIETQLRLLKGLTTLRIATTREFAARILAPQLKFFLSSRENLQIEVISSQDRVENLLLKGEADIGLDCGRPQDPSVKFQRVIPESFSIVASPLFLKNNNFSKKISPTFSDLLLSPYLQYTRLSAGKLLSLNADLIRSQIRFNDIAALRSACVLGTGWTVLPTYSVQDELDSGVLVKLRGPSYPQIENEAFGVWWLRDRKNLENWANQMTTWLKNQKL